MTDAAASGAVRVGRTSPSDITWIVAPRNRLAAAAVVGLAALASVAGLAVWVAQGWPWPEEQAPGAWLWALFGASFVAFLGAVAWLLAGRGGGVGKTRTGALVVTGTSVRDALVVAPAAQCRVECIGQGRDDEGSPAEPWAVELVCPDGVRVLLALSDERDAAQRFASWVRRQASLPGGEEESRGAAAWGASEAAPPSLGLSVRRGWPLGPAGLFGGLALLLLGVALLVTAWDRIELSILIGVNLALFGLVFVVLTGLKAAARERVRVADGHVERTLQVGPVTVLRARLDTGRAGEWWARLRPHPLQGWRLEVVAGNRGLAAGVGATCRSRPAGLETLLAACRALNARAASDGRAAAPSPRPAT